MLNKLRPTIAIIDSGIGGVSIFNKLIDKYQSGNFIYFADNLNMPYGTKSKEFIKRRILEIIDNLKSKYKVDIIIIACNTASSVLKNVNISSVIKLEFNNKSATYLTTPLTEKNLKGVSTISNSILASEIEDNIHNQKKLDQIIKNEVRKQKLNKLSNLILGCTHYELVIDLFKKYCPKTNVTSNSDYILGKVNYMPETEELTIYFITTKQDKTYLDKLKSIVKN